MVVFRLKQRNTTNNSHDFIWVDPKTALITRRVQYNGDNVLKQEVRYPKGVQIQPGIWVPTRVELYNQYGKRASVQVFEDMQVNKGVNDSVFKL